MKNDSKHSWEVQIFDMKLAPPTETSPDPTTVVVTSDNRLLPILFFFLHNNKSYVTIFCNCFYQSKPSRSQRDTKCSDSVGCCMEKKLLSECC